MTIMDLAHAAGFDADAQLAGKLQVFALLVQHVVPTLLQYSVASKCCLGLEKYGFG